MPAPSSMTLTPGGLTLNGLHEFWRSPRPVQLASEAWPAIDAAAACVAQTVARGQRVYGINTGFGKLARTTIGTEKLRELQRRLILSHSAGVGEPLPDRVVRLVLLIKINSLARGYSGVRPELLRGLMTLLEHDALPVIPAQGSVGASGDLAPLAHLSACLIGEGWVRFKGEVINAGQLSNLIDFSPIALEAKEGLALINGSQVSTALALDGLFGLLDAFAAALAAGALSLDAALGSDTPFDPRIQAVRGQPGQATVAAILKRLLAGSAIRASHADCERVQDPYSLRCQPQVMGAALDVLRSAAAMLEREANAVSDNPLVFAADGEILSGGNFHAEPVAFAADMLALSLAEVAALSERRTALLVDASQSELPAFLVAEPGLNSGFMIAQVTAAALASEIKQMSHPAVVDSLPTSANQEDHVSMATHGARRLGPMLANLRGVLAVELLAAAQGVDFRKPLETSEPLAAAMAEIRRRAPFLAEDRAISGDIEAIAALIKEGWFLDHLVSKKNLLID